VKKQQGPNVAKIAGAVGVVVVLLIAGWFVLVHPKRSEAAKLSREIDDTRAQIAAAQAGGPESPDTQQIRVADLFKLSRAMPDREDIPNVLLQLSQISAETGISFQSIEPHDPVLLGSYEQISIDLVFQGHFYDLSDFLYRLRNLVGVHGGVLSATGRLFSVDKISFDEGELKFPQVKAELTVSAYVFGDGTYTSVPVAPPPLSTTPSSTEPPPAAVPSVTTTAPATDEAQPIPPAPPGATAAGALRR
jgi:hypothetical protein